MTAPDEQARTQFTEFSDAVSQTLEEVRTISYDLRPSHLDQLGLRTAIVAMIEKVSASSTIQFTHAVDELDGLLRPGDEITLYRIVQECLNNILKHSGATKVALNLAVQAGELALTIRDNGRGFMPNEETHWRAGLGLQGIAERVRILGGTHVIESAPGQGTAVTLRIALKDKQR
jgi:signal transduction histidine kinase